MRCVNTRTIRTKPSLGTEGFLVSEYIEVGCGTCYACRLKKVDHWIDRLEMESRVNPHPPLFLTLTYNNENVPKNEKGILCLKLRDVQLFLKRLRKGIPGSRIRYIYLGEYGGRTARPHYHAILFGIPKSTFGDYSHGQLSLYKSRRQAFFEQYWGNGQVSVSNVTHKRIAYCASFHINSAEWPLGATRPFVQYSRRPGLGHGYTNDPLLSQSHDPGFDPSTGEMFPVQPHHLMYIRRSGERRPLPPYTRRILFPGVYPIPIKIQRTEEFLLSLHPTRSPIQTKADINRDYDRRLLKKLSDHGKYIRLCSSSEIKEEPF